MFVKILHLINPTNDVVSRDKNSFMYMYKQFVQSISYDSLPISYLHKSAQSTCLLYPTLTPVPSYIYIPSKLILFDFRRYLLLYFHLKSILSFRSQTLNFCIVISYLYEGKT